MTISGDIYVDNALNATDILLSNNIDIDNNAM